MQLVRLTKENLSEEYIGYEILFKTRGKHIVKRILGIANTCVYIDHPDLKNNLQLGRKIYLIIE